MEFIYTDKNFVELGFIKKATIDIEIGKSSISKNDFELTISSFGREERFDKGSLFFCNNSEFGGIVESKKVDTSTNNIIFKGFTFRGILKKEYIQPPKNQAYFIASGEANTIIKKLIDSRFGDLFIVDNVGLSDIIVNYQIRDINLLEAIEKMLQKASIPSRLDISFFDGKVHLQAIKIMDLSEQLQFDNSYGLTIIAETKSDPYNHILALGKGELTERTRVNLYIDKNGLWTSNENDSFYKEMNRKTYKYENTNEEDVDALMSDAIDKVLDENGTDTISISFSSDSANLFDIVGAKEDITGISMKEQVSQKILKGSINGSISSLKIDYKVGE